MRACEQKGAQCCNGAVNRIEYFAKKVSDPGNRLCDWGCYFCQGVLTHVCSGMQTRGQEINLEWLRL